MAASAGTHFVSAILVIIFPWSTTSYYITYLNTYSLPCLPQSTLPDPSSCRSYYSCTDGLKWTSNICSQAHAPFFYVASGKCQRHNPCCSNCSGDCIDKECIQDVSSGSIFVRQRRQAKPSAVLTTTPVTTTAKGAATTQRVTIAIAPTLHGVTTSSRALSSTTTAAGIAVTTVLPAGMTSAKAPVNIATNSTSRPSSGVTTPSRPLSVSVTTTVKAPNTSSRPLYPTSGRPTSASDNGTDSSRLTVILVSVLATSVTVFLAVLIILIWKRKTLCQRRRQPSNKQIPQKTSYPVGSSGEERLRPVSQPLLALENAEYMASGMLMGVRGDGEDDVTSQMPYAKPYACTSLVSPPNRAEAHTVRGAGVDESPYYTVPPVAMYNHLDSYRQPVVSQALNSDEHMYTSLIAQQ